MRKKKITITLFAMACNLSLFTSCDNNETFIELEKSTQEVACMDEQTAMTRFAEVLSKATYERRDVRQFLKDEAKKQFDYNNDVLYINVKNSPIGNRTFENILCEYTNKEELEKIVQAVPTINIFIPQIAAFNLYPENMDCSDKEIPVVLPNESSNSLYLDGEIAGTLSKGDVPGFHVFVVNKNRRVTVNTNTRSANYEYSFIAPEYDNTKAPDVTRTYLVDANFVGNKAINAYSHFFKDDGSNQSMALQRDYIYYGMTPTSENGSLNQSVSEYLSFIEIDPKAYFNMTEIKDVDPLTDDPEVYKEQASRKKRDFTKEELIDEFWTEGNYNIKIEIAGALSSQPLIKHLSVSPDDIWEFNLDRTYRHSTAFRHSKYTYKIDVDKFTAKRYDLTDKLLSLGKWDLSQESLYKRISFIEEDPGDVITTKYILETTMVNSSKVNGSIKFGLGLGNGNSTNIETGSENSSSVTTKESVEISVTRTNKDDDLGEDLIYFYEPIIVGTSGEQYDIKTHTTGIVTFGITAK